MTDTARRRLANARAAVVEEALADAGEHGWTEAVLEGAIARAGIDAPLGVRSVPASLDMPSPTGPADVVLYDFSVAPHYGGMPGQGGNAVLSGGEQCDDGNQLRGDGCDEQCHFETNGGCGCATARASKAMTTVREPTKWAPVRCVLQLIRLHLLRHQWPKLHRRPSLPTKLQPRFPQRHL